MIQIRTSFAVPWLTITCSAGREDSELSADAVLQRVRNYLELLNAATTYDRTTKVLRYRGTWRSSRSWVLSVARGVVRIESARNSTVVRVQGSLVPTLAPAILFLAILLATSQRVLAVLALVVATLFNTRYVHKGMRSLATTSLQI